MESITEIADKVDAEGKKLDDNFKKQVLWSSLVFAIILVVLCIPVGGIKKPPEN